MDKESGWVEGGVYNTRRVIQANYNIFWTEKLTSHILDYNEQNLVKSHQY